ncbi:efflux RND transporter permease subunit [Acidobacteria bacterium AH-259-L09]|nr:efflux RND transporter permease subunit [Acidobacteria bacterium AH-259-L09]
MRSSTYRPGEGLTAGSAYRLSGFSIRYPVTICMLLVSFLLLGAVSIYKIPLVLFPSLNAPVVVVVVPYPNSTPGQVQDSITKPLEEVLSTIPHVDRITSRSSADEAVIELMFPWDQDIDLLRSEVRETVEQARKDLPEDVDRILVLNFNTNDIPIVEGRIASGRDLRGSYGLLDLKIKKPLESVPGVADVSLGGVERREVDIYLRIDEIKRYRVDVDALFRRLDSANLNLALGEIEDGGSRYRVLSKGAVDSLDQIANFPANDRGLTLSDIADVQLRDPEPVFGRHLNGEFAVSLEIRKASDANTVETVNRVLAKIEELNRDPALEGIEVLIWHNSGEEITKSLSGLLNAGFIGAILAVGVLYLFLRRIGPTLLIGVSIPFSIVASIGFLYLLGNSLNVLSMMGLMLATGMLVDNAVVVLESICQQLEKGQTRVSAACVGTQEVIRAVMAATLTSIIIFVPLVFGKETNLTIFLGHTGTAIIITLLCSLFVSLTLIPLGAARLLSARMEKSPPWQRALGARMKGALRWFFGRRGGSGRADGTGDSQQASIPQSPVVERYLQLMGWTLRHRYLVGFLIVPLVLGVSSWLLFNLPDSSPEAQELQSLGVEYEFTENYHYAKIEQDYVVPVEEFLLENGKRLKIKDVYSFYANNEAATRIYFDKERITLDELKDVRKQIAAGLPVIPGAEIRLDFQEGAENRNWIGVNLYGEDSTILMELAREAKKRFIGSGQFAEIRRALDRGQQEVQLVLDRQLAKRYNVSPESVSNILGIVLRGREIRGYRTSQGEVDIWIKLQPSDRENLSDLKSMVVGAGPNGEQILLSQVADLRIVRSPGSIQRENRRTYTEILSNYGGDKQDEGKKLISETMEGLDFPPGYSWSFGFWTQRGNKQEQEFAFNILLALFMVYFVMAALFESLAHPFAIMISLLFAAAGVAWFLFLTGTPFNIMAQIGILILIGIVVNNGIVLIDHINNLRHKGLDRSQAVFEGCRERFRPILMTAGTTVAGLMPLALGTSSLFDLRYFPMARTLMGGLMASTVLTLVVLPTYYTLIDDFSIGLKRLWRASSPEAVQQSSQETAALR